MIPGRCPILVERDEELRALSALASGVAAGAGWTVAVITGEAGAGKSRLAQELAASLPDGWSAHVVHITRSGALLPACLDDAHFLTDVM